MMYDRPRSVDYRKPQPPPRGQSRDVWYVLAAVFALAAALGVAAALTGCYRPAPPEDEVEAVQPSSPPVRFMTPHGLAAIEGAYAENPVTAPTDVYVNDVLVTSIERPDRVRGRYRTEGYYATFQMDRGVEALAVGRRAVIKAAVRDTMRLVDGDGTVIVFAGGEVLDVP